MDLPSPSQRWMMLIFILVFCRVVETSLFYPCRSTSMNGKTCNITRTDEYCFAEFSAEENVFLVEKAKFGCYDHLLDVKLKPTELFKEEFVWLQNNTFTLNVYCRSNESLLIDCMDKIEQIFRALFLNFPFEDITNVLNSQKPKNGTVKCMCEGSMSKCSPLIDDFTNVGSTSEFYCAIDADTPTTKMCINGYSIRISSEIGKNYGLMTTTRLHCRNTSSLVIQPELLRRVVKTVDNETIDIESLCIDRDFCNTDNFELYLTLLLNKTLNPSSLDPRKNTFSFYLFDESKTQTYCACNLVNSNCSYAPYCVSTDVCFRTVKTKLITKSGGYDSKITTHCSRRNVAYKDTISDTAIVWKTRSIFVTTCSNNIYESGQECNSVAKSQFETYCIDKRDNFVVKLWISEYNEPTVFSCVCSTFTADPYKSDVDCTREGKCFFKATDNSSCQNYRRTAVHSFASLCKNISYEDRDIIVQCMYQPPFSNIMDCRFAAACNKMTGLNVFNYICPWSNDFIKSPRPSLSTMPYRSTNATVDHTLPLDCICNEGNCKFENPSDEFGKCTFNPDDTNAVCYTRFVNLAMDGLSMKAFGCSNVDKDDEPFDYRRTISLFPEGRFMFKFECRTVDECKSEERNKESSCFFDKSPPYWFHNRLEKCNCETNGMQKGYEDFCNSSTSECYWSEIYKKTEASDKRFRINPDPAFYCSSFYTNVTETTPVSEIKPVNGCYVDFGVNQFAAPVVSEILTVSGGKIRFYRLNSTTFEISNLAKQFQCPSKEDVILFGTSDTFSGSNSTGEPPASPKKQYIEPKEILGPVGAVVSIFMTIIVIVFVVYNLREVWKVEERWKKSAAKKKEAKNVENVLSKEKSPKIVTKIKSVKERSVAVSKKSELEKTEKSQTDKGKKGKGKTVQSRKEKSGKSGKEKSATTKTPESKSKTPTKSGPISKYSPIKKPKKLF